MLWDAMVFSSISRIGNYTGISGRFLIQCAASDNLFMNIQNRTKCYNYQDCFQAFGERQLMPITNTWENIIYCPRTMKMLENSDP